MKKKILGIMFVFAILVTLNIYAQAADVSDLTFNSATGMITKCNTEASGELIIPSKIDDVDVIGIKMTAFSGCTKLNSIVILDGMELIEDWAFSGCSGIKSVTIPDTVKKLEGSVFQNCSSLESVRLSQNTELTSLQFTFEGY